MKKKLSILALSVFVTALLAINVKLAYAHNWGLWCWHTGSTVNVWIWGTHQNHANTALNDWDSHTDVNFNRVNYHTEISLFGKNWGATGWYGLASIKKVEYDYWHHWWWCRIKHAHATLNTFYVRSNPHKYHRTFCMEIGHCLGLAHSPHGCMGTTLNHTVPHNWADINAKF